MPGIRYGYQVVIAGLAVLFLIFLVSMVVLLTLALNGKMASISVTDLVALVGSITTVVGTTIGAFFGIQTGGAGRERAEAARDQAEAEAKKLAALAAQSNPDGVATILGMRVRDE